MKKSNTHKNSMKTDQIINSGMTNEVNNVTIDSTSTDGTTMGRKSKRENRKTNKNDIND